MTPVGPTQKPVSGRYAGDALPRPTNRRRRLTGLTGRESEASMTRARRRKLIEDLLWLVLVVYIALAVGLALGVLPAAG